MHTTPPKNDFGNYRNNTDMFITIIWSKMKGFRVEEADCIKDGSTQGEGKNQIEGSLADMIQLCNSSASNGTSSRFVRVLVRIVVELFSSGAAQGVMLEYAKRWSKSDKFMTSIVKVIVSTSRIPLLVAGFINLHMHPVSKTFASHNNAVYLKRQTRQKYF